MNNNNQHNSKPSSSTSLLSMAPYILYNQVGPFHGGANRGGGNPADDRAFILQTAQAVLDLVGDFDAATTGSNEALNNTNGAQQGSAPQRNDNGRPSQ